MKKNKHQFAETDWQYQTCFKINASSTKFLTNELTVNLNSGTPIFMELPSSGAVKTK